MMFRFTHIGIAAVLYAGCGLGMAALPQLTPEQEQQAAAKKAQADAQAEKEKQQLAESMDRIAAHWRERAQANGWATHAPTPVASKQGLDAPAAQSSASGQPGGKLGSAARNAPIRSEKHGTAPPSSDTKKTPADATQ